MVGALIGVGGFISGYEYFFYKSIDGYGSINNYYSNCLNENDDSSVCCNNYFTDINKCIQDNLTDPCGNCKRQEGSHISDTCYGYDFKVDFCFNSLNDSCEYDLNSFNISDPNGCQNYFSKYCIPDIKNCYQTNVTYEIYNTTIHSKYKNRKDCETKYASCIKSPMGDFFYIFFIINMSLLSVFVFFMIELLAIYYCKKLREKKEDIKTKSLCLARDNSY